jgi:hypothetical protein
MQAPVRTLAVFYGWPSAINDARGDIGAATREFAGYDAVILGAGLEKDSHGDHAAMTEIVAAADNGWCRNGNGSTNLIFFFFFFFL